MQQASEHDPLNNVLSFRKNSGIKLCKSNTDYF